MADTRVQLEVEDWVRQTWMPQHFGVNFYRERLKIRSGGVLYPFGQGHTFAGVDCVVDWMHEQDVIAVRAS